MSTDLVNCGKAVNDDNENKPANELMDSPQITTSPDESDSIGLV